MGAKDLFIIAGENSGDLHGSNLVRELLKLDPSLRISGIGGSQMRQAGVNLLANIVDRLAIIGFTGVIKNAERLFRLYRKVVHFLDEVRPAAVILIDYPGFNFKVMRAAKKRGIPVVYYIMPQVWAWHRSRIYTLKELTERLLVVFPFEKKLCESVNIKQVRYVGHPLLDVMNLTMTKEEVFAKFNFDPKKKLIGLLPGSRKPEIDRLLPAMLGAAERIQKALPDVQFALPRASTIKPELIQYYLSTANVEVSMVDAFRYNVRSAMDFALVKSGTSTLETAILGCPMVVVYKVSFIAWIIGKSVVKLPYIGLVNIIAGEMLVPELLQNEATPMNIAEKTIEMLQDEKRLEGVRYALKKVTEKLGGPGASRCAAENV
ncbi:MAG: lipid-A-disaccharide synthase, partial [Candidatus Sumerlaeota bacterium]|nr:lipid-A-disaccharide synthase [Candidatus Sumerlaeota bacterium]